MIHGSPREHLLYDDKGFKTPLRSPESIYKTRRWSRKDTLIHHFYPPSLLIFFFIILYSLCILPIFLVFRDSKIILRERKRNTDQQTIKKNENWTEQTREKHSHFSPLNRSMTLSKHPLSEAERDWTLKENRTLLKASLWRDRVSDLTWWKSRLWSGVYQWT